MARSDSAVQVYNYVREQIIQRRFFPGTQIVEEELASAVQTSRATVRNALTRLHYDGLVDLIPNRGAFVAKPTLDDMKKVFALRRLLEKEALKAAIPRIGREELDALTVNLEKQRCLGSRHTIEEYILLNNEFHWIIIRAAQNPYLERFLQELFSKTTIFLAFYDNSSTNSKSLETHTELFRAVERGDEAAALRMLDEDIDCAEESIHLQ